VAEGLSFRRGSDRRGPRLAPLLVAGVLLAVLGFVSWWLTPSAPAGTLVEVRGDVPRPGFHRVEPATLRTALEAAGRPGSTSATPLHTGDLVRVQPDGVSIHPAGNPLLVGLPVDLNDAGPGALEAVPGIGHELAVAIVLDRQRRGPFYEVAELARVRGIGPGTVEQVAPLVTVGDVGPRPEPRPVDLNHATALELESLPGIGPVLASRIVVDRDEHGPFRGIDDLQRVKGVGPAIVAGVRQAGVVVGE